MSTKSLDLSLPVRQHRRQPSSELTPLQFTRDMKAKIDTNRLQCYEELGARLIEDRLLLTALELYAELGEAGHEILCLKQFFSNPGNFEKSAKTEGSRFLVRSLSQTTLDSLDFAPISEDGDRTGGDRVAILEFELRKAQETIAALRANLTHQVELENASIRSETESTGSQNNSSLNHQTTPEPIRAYEQRAINFLVHEYLLTHGYRLTSITFSDENTDQDFEHWDDVGLNTERPADLLSLYRHRSRSLNATHLVSSEDAETQTEEVANDSMSSADVTMQLGGFSVEDFSHDVSIAHLAPAKTVVANAQDTDVNLAQSLSTKPAMRQPLECGIPPPKSPVVPHQLAGVRSEPTGQPPSLQNIQLTNSARALKDELQQGVEDVCQKLNNFFGKPHSLSGGSGSRQAPTGLAGKPNPDRPSFSLFNSK